MDGYRFFQDRAAKILSQRMHIDICDIDADCGGIPVNLFIMYIILKMFEKKVDGFRCFIVDGTGSEMGVHQIFIRDKGLDRIGIELLDQGKFIFHSL